MNKEGDIMYKGKKIFILGMARSGYEAAKLLAHHENQILITDQKEQNPDMVQELMELGVNYIVTNDPCSLLDETYDYLIKNPGIPRTHECVQKAIALNIPVINEVEMAYHFLPKDICIIGVTGSNGKTTTVTILHEFLKLAGLPVHLGGNIGYPLSSLVNEVKAGDILLLEISDHQLCDMYDFKTNISVLTNLTKTHLDFHKDYDTYKEMKKRIFNHHTKDDIAILNYDNREVLELTEDIASHKMYFSHDEEVDIYFKDDTIYYGKEEVIKTDMIRVKGMHNYENIMCAIAVAKHFKVTNAIIKGVLNNFGGVEHRIEYVRKLNGREFYNDSKATNPKSTEIALSAFTNPIILILGGMDRETSFDGLKEHMKYVKQVIALGETKDKIEAMCDAIKIDCIKVNNMEEAVKVSYNLSNQNDTILLSPACASWDMYPNFETRGNEFKKYVDELE